MIGVIEYDPLGLHRRARFGKGEFVPKTEPQDTTQLTPEQMQEFLKKFPAFLTPPSSEPPAEKTTATEPAPEPEKPWYVKYRTHLLVGGAVLLAGGAFLLLRRPQPAMGFLDDCDCSR